MMCTPRFAYLWCLYYWNLVLIWFKLQVKIYMPHNLSTLAYIGSEHFFFCHFAARDWDTMALISYKYHYSLLFFLYLQANYLPNYILSNGDISKPAKLVGIDTRSVRTWDALLDKVCSSINTLFPFRLVRPWCVGLCHSLWKLFVDQSSNEKQAHHLAIYQPVL